MRYLPYITFREQLVGTIRREMGLSKSYKRDRKFADSIVEMWLKEPGNSESMNTSLLIDEEDYVLGCGHRIYFPESSGLLRVLMRAKMDILPSDVGLFPNAFSIAFPDDYEFDGMRPVGTLVWFGTERERRAIHQQFASKYFHGEEIVWRSNRKDVSLDERMLCLSYSSKMGDKVFYFRCVIPEPKLSIGLESPESLHSSIGVLDSAYTLSLSADELRHQHLMLKLVCRLLVYATARPESVVDGWPGNCGPRDISRGLFREFSPSRLTLPKQERGCPGLHWRQWHFRRYPLINGYRRPGVVFVDACIVGSEKTPNPRTVIEVKKT